MPSTLDNAIISVTTSLNKFLRPAVKAGLGNPLPVGAGLVVLETAGRKTGIARQVPLVATRLGDRVVVSTGRSDSQWFKNLAVDDAPSVFLGGRRRPASVSVTPGRLNVAVLTMRD